MPFARRLPALVLAALLAAAPGAARPDEAAPPGAAPRRALALTVSGGASLGAYEAGFVHYMAELSRSNPLRTELALVTGTSAGATNAVLAILSGCTAERVRIEDSLHWRTWIPLGLDALEGPADPPRQGLFSRRGLLDAAALVRRAWEEGLSDGCDVTLGVAVTRLVPRAVAAPSRSLALPRIEEKVAVRIRGLGPGVPPRITNFFDPGHPLEQLVLPERPDGTVAFDDLQDLVLASTSFPVAFPPRAVRHCVVPPLSGPFACEDERVETALFVDGGVFDNAPLRLAARLGAAGLRDDGAGGTSWLAVPSFARREPPAALLHVFVAPDATVYPLPEQRHALGPDTPVLGVAGQVFGAFVASARAKELQTLLEEDPRLADRVLVPARHLPAASDGLEGFLGFAERDFRAFDFHLGMYEARRLATDVIAPRLEAEGRPGFRFPEEDPALAADPAWRPLACLRAVADGAGPAEAACAGPELAPFRILLATSLDRLYDACALRDGEEGRATSDPLCLRARAGQEPPPVPGVAPLPPGAFRRGAGEGQLEHVFRLLAARGFAFRDLGLREGEGDLALEALRGRLEAMGLRLAAAQPGQDRFVVASATRLAANTLLWSPPRTIVHLGVGREVELGASARLARRGRLLPTLRLQLAVQLHGLSSLVSSDPDPFAAAVLGGLVHTPRALSSAWLQLSLGARAGWILSEGDGYGAGACEGIDRDRIGGCSGPVGQLVLSASALERVRLQLSADAYPRFGARRAQWSLSPAIGVQVAF
jgi:predicted acylesterase/phospholipase RssA